MSWNAGGFYQSLLRARDAVQPSSELRLEQFGSELLHDMTDRGDFPYDTGSLLESGSVSAVEWQGGKAIVTLSFGGPSTGPNDPVDYAGFVHEGTQFMAPRPYLSGPLQEDGPTYLQDATEAVLRDVQRAWNE